MSVTNVAKRRGKILDEIMAYHRENLPKIKRDVSLATVQALATVAPTPCDFYAALHQPGVSVIAECKKASPSKGLMVPDYDAVRFAKIYAQAGARAVSILTDTRHFQGTLADLRDVKEALPQLPALRKDFIFDPYQIYEARGVGADGILLIAAVLPLGLMKELLALTHELGMNALIEVHSADELEAVLTLNPRIVGINNRNLQTFEVDFANTARLRQMIPADVVVVAESGLQSADDVRTLAKIGVSAVLVGETFVTSRNIRETVRAFVQAGQLP